MDIWYFLIRTYWGGLLHLFLGLILIWWIQKYPNKKANDWFQGDTKGIVGGVGFILIGITILIAKLCGKL